MIDDLFRTDANPAPAHSMSMQPAPGAGLGRLNSRNFAPTAGSD